MLDAAYQTQFKCVYMKLFLPFLKDRYDLTFWIYQMGEALKENHLLLEGVMSVVHVF